MGGVIDMSSCDCCGGLVADCFNCNAGTTRAQYTLTFSGFPAGYSCTMLECERLVEFPIVVTQDAGFPCYYEYFSPVVNCADFQVRMFLNDASFVIVQVIMGAGDLIIEFLKAWAPPAHCGNPDVIGVYAQNYNSGTFCDFTSTALLVGL